MYKNVKTVVYTGDNVNELIKKIKEKFIPGRYIIEEQILSEGDYKYIEYTKSKGVQELKEPKEIFEKIIKDDFKKVKIKISNTHGFIVIEVEKSDERKDNIFLQNINYISDIDTIVDRIINLTKADKEYLLMLVNLLKKICRETNVDKKKLELLQNLYYEAYKCNVGNIAWKANGK